MTRVSLTEDYDDRSVISKLNTMSKQIDANTSTVESAVASASESAASAQRVADTFAGSVGSVVAEAKADMLASKNAALEAASTVADISDKVDVISDKADLAVETANGIASTASAAHDTAIQAERVATQALGRANSVVADVQQFDARMDQIELDVSQAKSEANSAFLNVDQVSQSLTAYKTTVSNTYATKTEVTGKLTESQADAKYQPIGNYQPAGNYITEAQGDAKYELKGQGGGSGVWGQITGNVTDQEDLIQYVDSRTSGLVTSDTLNQETAWAKNTAVEEAKAYVDAKPFTNKEYVDTSVSTAKTQCNNYTDTKVATMSGTLMQEISGKQPAGNYALVSQIPDVSDFITVTDAARDYQPKGEYVTKGEITGVYRFRGSKTTKSQLPTEDNMIGDVWNVASTGMNYAWDGEAWDALGMDVDLSDYVTTTQMGNYVAQEIVPVTNRIGDLEEFQSTATAEIQANTTAIAGKADTDILIGVSNHVDVVEDNLNALEQRVSALEPEEGSITWADLHEDTEIQGMPPSGTMWRGTGEWNGKTIDKLYVVTDGTPMDFGKVMYNGTAGEMAIWWVLLTDPTGWSYTYGDGSTGPVSEMPTDKDGFPIDELKHVQVLPFTASMRTGSGDISVTIDVGGEPAPKTVSIENGSVYLGDVDATESWNTEGSNFTKEIKLGKLGIGLPLADNDVLIVSPHPGDLATAIDAGWIGCVCYNSQENRVKIMASTQNTYRVNITVIRG